MLPDKLQSLLYAYIENRHVVDDVDCPGELSVEIDHVVPYRHYADFVTPVLQQWHPPPLLPVQLPPIAPLNAAQSQSITRAGRSLVQMAQQHSTAHPHKSLVKFKEICLVVEPKEQTISIPVIRDQTLIDKETKISWETCNKTAVSGTHFGGSTGEIVFGIGDTEKFIEIKILDFKDSADDLRFYVKILDCGGLYLPTPLTVTLKKVSVFDPYERNVLRGLRNVLHGFSDSLPFSIDEIRYIVKGCLTARTFHMALTHLCSTNQIVDVQLALAFELTSLCCNELGLNSSLNVLRNYFREDDINLESLQN